MPWQSASVQITLSAPEVGIATLLGEGQLCVCWEENFGSIYINHLWCPKKDDSRACISVMPKHLHVLIFCKRLCGFIHHSPSSAHRETSPKVHPLSAGPGTTRLKLISGLRHQSSQMQPGARIYLSFLFCPREMQDGTRTTCTQQKLKHHVCISLYQSVCTRLWTHFRV